MRYVDAIAFAIALSQASIAEAASYGDFESPFGIRYVDVRDRDGSFGMPQIDFRSLVFDESTLRVQCNRCAGAIASDILTLEIEATGAARLHTLGVEEHVEFVLQSFDPEGSVIAAFTSTLFVDILEIDHRPVDSLDTNASVQFDANGVRRLDGIAGRTGLAEGSIEMIDLDLPIAAAGLSGHATRVRLSLDLTFYGSQSSLAGQVLVRSRNRGGAIEIVANRGSWSVPEPATGVMALIGLIVLARRPHAPSRIEARP